MNETISNKISELKKEIFKIENEGKSIIIAEKFFGDYQIGLYSFSVKFLKSDISNQTGIINTLIAINKDNLIQSFNFIVE